MYRLTVLLIFLNWSVSAHAQERITVLVCRTESQIWNILHHWQRYDRSEAEIVFALYANQFYAVGKPYCFEGKEFKVVEIKVTGNFQVDPEYPIGYVRGVQMSEVHTSSNEVFHALVIFEVLGVVTQSSALLADTK